MSENQQWRAKTIEVGNLFLDKTWEPSGGITIAKLIGLGVQDLATAMAVRNRLTSIDVSNQDGADHNQVK